MFVNVFLAHRRQKPLSPVKGKSSGSKSKVPSSSDDETTSTSAPELVSSNNSHQLSLPTVSVSVSIYADQLPVVSQAPVSNPSRSFPATTVHSSASFFHSSSVELSPVRGVLQSIPTWPSNSHRLSDSDLPDVMPIHHRPMAVHHPAAYDGSVASSSRGILTLLASEERERFICIFYMHYWLWSVNSSSINKYQFLLTGFLLCV